MGKTRDLFKKIRDPKGTFHAKMGSIKQKVHEGSGGVGCGGSPLVPAPGVATGPSIAKSGRA